VEAMGQRHHCPWQRLRQSGEEASRWRTGGWGREAASKTLEESPLCDWLGGKEVAFPIKHKMEARSKVKEIESDRSSPGCLGSIATRVIVWLYEAVTTDTSLTLQV
jgi:hypothetical protein